MPKKILFIGENHDDVGTINMLQQMIEAKIKAGERVPCILVEGYSGMLDNALIIQRTASFVKKIHEILGIDHYEKRAPTPNKEDVEKKILEAKRSGRLCEDDFNLLRLIISKPGLMDIFLSNPDRFEAVLKFNQFAEAQGVKICDLEPERIPGLRSIALSDRRIFDSVRPERDKRMSDIAVEKLQDNDELFVLCGALHVEGIMNNIETAYKGGLVPGGVEMHVITKIAINPRHDLESEREFETFNETFLGLCEIFDCKPKSLVASAILGGAVKGGGSASRN